MHVSTYATISQVCSVREKSGNMFVKWVERLSEIYNQVNIVEDISDNYPSISKNKANQRVALAVEEYRNGTMKTVPYNQGMDKIGSWFVDFTQPFHPFHKHVSTFFAN